MILAIEFILGMFFGIALTFIYIFWGYKPFDTIHNIATRGL